METSNFRNNPPKCVFNDTGFCKYKESCRKHHFSEKCEDQKCDRKCTNRHPKECNRGENCKFLKQKICAYDHDNSEKINEDKENLIDNIKEEVLKQFEREINAIKQNYLKEIENIKIMCEEKAKEMEVIKKEHTDEIKAIKKEYTNEIKEIKKVHTDKIKEIKKEHTGEINEIKTKIKEHDKKMKEIENIKKETIENRTEIECLELGVNRNKLDDPIEKEIITKSINKEPESVKEKPKGKKKKLTKDIIQTEIIEEFKKDGNRILEDRNDLGRDVYSKKCKKCDYETHSEGVLRVHKVEDHKLKESKENIIIGFNNDVKDHIAILTELQENLNNVRCDQCDFTTHSLGLLKIHVCGTHI